MGGVVIETWQEGESWYRKWNDGWVEQGGQVGGGSIVNITFGIAFRDTAYAVLLTSTGNPGESYAKVASNKITSGFSVISSGAGAIALSALWYACGYAAE